MITHQTYLSLVNKLVQHCLDYERGEPSISDQTYDALYQQVCDYEASFPDKRHPDSPSRRFPVGNLFTPFTHDVPLLSLANIYNDDDLHHFDHQTHQKLSHYPASINLGYTLEPKLDGVAVSVRYKAGRLYVAATRGNGITGDIITAHVTRIKTLPTTLAQPVTLDCRGELYMTTADFNALNQTTDRQFATPRNTVAGTIRQLDPDKTANRRLSICIYQGITDDPAAPDTHYDRIQWLADLGLPTSQPYLSYHETIGDITGYIPNFFNHVQPALPYDTDGCVIKVNNLQYYPDLKARAKTVRWAVAYKPATQQACTTVQSIQPQVGRTGVLTPVAHLDPVTLQGVTIQRVSLYNYDEIDRLSIGPGDTVSVARAGDVIPKIMAVVSSVNQLVLRPTHCPVCDTPVHIDKTAIRCLNWHCAAQLKARLVHYASRDAMAIQGLGDAIITQLVDRGLVQTIPDLYSLAPDALMALDKMGAVLAKKLVTAIQSTRNPTLPVFLYALGVPGIGQTAANLIAQTAGTIESVMTLSQDTVLNIPGLGPHTAASFETCQAMLPDLVGILQSYGMRISPVMQPKEQPEASVFQGKHIVITGKFEQLSRQLISERLKAYGAIIDKSVTKKTDILIVADASNQTGNKWQQAQTYIASGIPIDIWSEDRIKPHIIV